MSSAGRTHPPPQDDPSLRLAINSIDGSPAFAANHIFDVLAFNDLADRIYAFDAIPSLRE